MSTSTTPPSPLDQMLSCVCLLTVHAAARDYVQISDFKEGGTAIEAVV